MVPLKPLPVYPTVNDQILANLEASFPTPQVQDKPKQAAFNSAADRTLARAAAIHQQRGSEYEDSWALENVHAPFITHVLREVFGLTGASAEELRLVMAAALVDVKDSRMGGVFKLDTIDDGINYRAAFCSWMEDYQSGHD
jgi:hypothetical protein